MGQHEGEERGLINVKPGDPCFLVGNALCNCFSIGLEGETEFFLRGEIVDGAFTFSGLLFPAETYASGVPLVAFPRGAPPSGWLVQPLSEGRGHALVSRRTGETLFAYRVDEAICRITTDLYNEAGARVASVADGGFTVLRGPARLGTSGILIA